MQAGDTGTKLTTEDNIPTILVEVEGDGWSWGW